MDCLPITLNTNRSLPPVVRAGEKALDDADDADASCARFDAPLVRDGRRAGQAVGLGNPLSQRFPGRHGGTELHARGHAHLHGDGLPVTLLDLGGVAQRAGDY